MATGPTNSTTITKMVRRYIADMQFVHENPQMMAKLVNKETLPASQGLEFHKPVVGTIDAFEAAMDQEFNNPQRIRDDSEIYTPTEKITQVLWPKRLNRYITESMPSIVAHTTTGALEYKRDRDILTLLASTTGVLGNGGGPLTVGIVSAGMSVIEPGIPANGSVARQDVRETGDPSDGPWYVLGHPFNQHDLRGQLSGLGGTSALTAAVAANFPTVAGTTGFNEAQIRRHYRGAIANADFMVNGNLPITNAQVRGGVWAKKAFDHITYQGVQHGEMETADRRFIKVTAWIDYAIGIWNSVWASQLFLDASVPSS